MNSLGHLSLVPCVSSPRYGWRNRITVLLPHDVIRCQIVLWRGCINSPSKILFDILQVKFSSSPADCSSSVSSLAPFVVDAGALWSLLPPNHSSVLHSQDFKYCLDTDGSQIYISTYFYNQKDNGTKTGTLIYCRWACKLEMFSGKAVWRFLSKLKMHTPSSPTSRNVSKTTPAFLKNDCIQN